MTFFRYLLAILEIEKNINNYTSKIIRKNAIKFLNEEGNAHPVVWALFNMVISLGLLIFNFHNEDLKENKIFKQSLLTDFFNKIK